MLFRVTQMAQLGLLCSVLASFNVFASDLVDLLENIAKAENEQNYQGVFILRGNNNISTMQVTHGIGESGVWENIKSLNGEPKKIVRRNNKVISINNHSLPFQNQNKSSIHRQLPEDSHQIEYNYTIKKLGEDRIADHQTHVIEILANDKYRYNYRYWIDKKTSLLLRCDLIGNNKQVIEQMMFTVINYLPDEPTPLKLDAVDYFKKQQSHQDKAENSTELKKVINQWVVNQLPKGFLLAQRSYRAVMPKLKNSPKVLHLLYSDGLASVSVFIEKDKKEKAHHPSSSSMGAVNIYSQAVNDYFVTVVGDVPKRTVQVMAKSIRQVTPANQAK